LFLVEVRASGVAESVVLNEADGDVKLMEGTRAERGKNASIQSNAVPVIKMANKRIERNDGGFKPRGEGEGK